MHNYLLAWSKHCNDLPLHVSSSKNDLYADDTTITSSADCGSMGRLQESLLDLEIDEELPFSEHITTVSKKVTQRIGLFKKIMNSLPLNKDYLINWPSYTLYAFFADILKYEFKMQEDALWIVKAYRAYFDTHTIHRMKLLDFHAWHRIWCSTSKNKLWQMAKHTEKGYDTYIWQFCFKYWRSEQVK